MLGICWDSFRRMRNRRFRTFARYSIYPKRQALCCLPGNKLCAAPNASGSKVPSLPDNLQVVRSIDAGVTKVSLLAGGV